MTQDLQSITHEINETLELMHKEKITLNRIRSTESLISDSHGRLDALKVQLIKEEKDLEKLQKFTISNIIHTFLRDKEAAEEKEISEVIQVKNQIDHLNFDLEDGERRLRRLNSELKGLDNLNKKYKDLLEDKAKIIEELYPMKWEEVQEINEDLEENSKIKIEVDEAISAGKKARSSAETIRTSLKKAEGWGTFDMLGGGLIATMAKRSHIDEAQDQLNYFRADLRSFSNELADVGKELSVDFNIGDFLRFADWFFDGFFVDWAVQSKISSALDQVIEVHDKINHLLSDLEIKEEKIKQRMTELNKNIETYIIDAI